MNPCVARRSAGDAAVNQASLVLPAGGSVTLYTGCGTDTATERYWCNTGSAVWNNDGDTAFLLDPDGNIVAQASY